MNKRLFVVVFLVLCFVHLPHAEAEEKITLSTYYPAPYGEYETLSVGSGYTAPLTDGWLSVESRIGIGITSPGYQLHLSQNSAAKPTSNTWTVPSDERIKKNISDFTDGLNIVMMLQPRNYQYNGLGGPGYDDTDSHIGFIAQEIEPICPYMVETGRGLIDGIQVDDFKVYQGHALSFVLVNAIQEQQEQIEALKKKIDFLESYLNIEE